MITQTAHQGLHGKHTPRRQIRSGRRQIEILSSSQRQTQATPFYSVLDRFPVRNPSVVAGVSDGDMVTTTLIPPISFPYSFSSSTDLLERPATQLGAPASPTASTPLALTTLQLGSWTSSSPAQTSPPQRPPSGPVIISFVSVTPIATLAGSKPRTDIHPASSSTMIPLSPSRVATETALQEVVTISLSASVSDPNTNTWPIPISSLLPTTVINDAGVSSHATNSGRPAAKAVGNAQSTFGAPSSSSTIPSALYPQQDLHLNLNPVTVVGCVLAGILAMTVTFFCVVWVSRARRRSRDDKMATMN